MNSTGPSFIMPGDLHDAMQHCVTHLDILLVACGGGRPDMKVVEKARIALRDYRALRTALSKQAIGMEAA